MPSPRPSLPRPFLLLLLFLSGSPAAIFGMNGWLYSDLFPYVYEYESASWHYVYVPEGSIVLTDVSGLVKKSWSARTDLEPDAVTGWFWSGPWPWMWSNDDRAWYFSAIHGATLWNYNFTTGSWEDTLIYDLATEPLVWDETFDDLAEGTTSDNGETAWTATATLGDGGSMKVTGGVFAIAKGQPGVWLSESISIGGDATVTVIHEGDPDMEENDYISISTIVDGGAPVRFVDALTGYYARRTDTTTVAGSTVQVRIDFYSTASTEVYQVDRVTVEGLDEFPKPHAASDLTAEVVSQTQIDLSWTDESNNETGFKIFRRIEDGASVELDTVEANVTTYSDQGLSPATTYTYIVVATNANGDAPDSNDAAATTWGTTPPPAPTLLSAAARGVVIDLEWTDNASDESGFEIFRQASFETEFASVATVDQNVTTYTDRNLAPLTEYTYKVLAFNPIGDSALSDPAVATTGEGTYPSADIEPLWPLTNASFELSTSTGGWLENDPNGVVSMMSSSSNPAAYDGAKVLRITNDTGFIQHALYQPVAGHRYEIRAWVYNHGTLSVEDLGTDDVFESSTNHGNSWQLISVSFVSTGSPAIFYLRYGPGSGSSYFDLVDTENVTSTADLNVPVPSVLMRYASQVIDLSGWKITLPINSAQEIYTPELITLNLDPWFKLVEDADGFAVQFRANHGGSTTSGSSNPRSELREMTPYYSIRDSKSQASWSNTDGKSHTLWIKQKVTHLTSVKPHVVVGQIHDSGDDVTVFRIEGHNTGVGVVNTHANLWITNGNTTHGYLVDGNYEIGTVFTVKFIAHDGIIEYEYNGERLAYTQTKSISGCYFKLGNYTQSHAGTAPSETNDAYAETYVYDYELSHE